MLTIEAAPISEVGVGPVLTTEPGSRIDAHDVMEPYGDRLMSVVMIHVL
jgi:hypothetical protein